MEVTILGTGAPEGLPVLGCDCYTCSYASTHSIERTRFSVHVENDRTG
jgi:phosphoribosyl 1,2-cyclic phosphate phosphodiesterase